MVKVDLDEMVEGGGGGVSIEHHLPHHLCAAKVQCLTEERKERRQKDRKKRKGNGRE